MAELTAQESRNISDEAWYFKEIRQAAEKNFYQVDIRCHSPAESNNISNTLLNLGYNITDVGKQNDIVGVHYILLVEW